MARTSPSKAAATRTGKAKATQKKLAVVKSPARKTAPARAKTAKPAVPRTPAPVRKARPAVTIQAKRARPEPAVIPAAKDLARDHANAAVNRALDLLEALARVGPVPLAVLAETAGCSKTAAMQHLKILQVRNFAIQDESHALWRLGARWNVLARTASEQGALAATAMPHLAALGNATGENVYLRVRDGMECETIAIYQTDPGLRVYTEVGKKMPLHAGSGRLLLAHAPEAVQTQILAQRLQRYTPSTRIDPIWIAADLHRIRQRGFLITESEVVAGTVSVCAPVRDAGGQVVASLLIGSPSLRMRPPRPRALMPMVVEAARKLSLALGLPIEAAPPPPPAPVLVKGEAKRLGDVTPRPWPSPAPVSAAAASIARPHSIFR